MPEDSKKNQHKGKHEVKEQRKPRQQRHADKSEKRTDKKTEEHKKTEKHTEVKVAPPKPEYEEPGPEFYKSLKRETDEILKITEETNAKYKKKEIQSNWSKYEMPIESYEEIEEQENLGADYEKLIQAPVSTGGHFQFKHEKSWDINTGPSLYDKYFEINMENLATAISTIPFHERSSIDESVFSQTDLISMNNRAVKYKRKYYNDKTYTTPEMKAQDTILNSIKDGLYKADNKEEKEISDDFEKKSSISESEDIVLQTTNESAETKPVNSAEDNLETKYVHETNTKLECSAVESNQNITVVEKAISRDTSKLDKLQEPVNMDHKEIDEILFEDTKSAVIITNSEDPLKNIKATSAAPPSTQSKVAGNPSTEAKKPVIESPEDLEKWLDDFLDG